MSFKSALAIAAGIGVNLLAVPVDFAVQASHAFPPVGPDSGEGFFVIALAYRAAFAVGGGWIASRLAPRSPLKHAWFLGGLGTLLACLGAVGQWDLGHHWYALALAAMSFPATWLGFRIFSWRIHGSSR